MVFSKKIKKQDTIEINSIEQILGQEQLDYDDYDKIREISERESRRYSSRQSGMPAFRNALDFIRIRRKEVWAEHDERINRLKQDKAELKQEIKELKEEKKNIETERRNKISELLKEIKDKYNNKISAQYGEIETLDKQIKNINCDIENLKNTNDRYNWSFGLIVETLLAIFLLLYLWVFYSAATYSAFFKNSDDLGNEVIKTFLDPTAISAAWHQGWSSGIFVVLFPIIFIALGYIAFQKENEDEIIEKKFMEKENKSFIQKIVNGFKVFFKSTAFIIMLAFSYDVLIAYMIAEGLYKQNIVLGETAPFNWIICLKDPHFWLVIGAGFIVYLIFGMICASVSKKWENFNTKRKNINLKEKNKHSKIAEKNYIENIKIPKLKDKWSEEDNEVEQQQQILLLDKEYNKKEEKIQIKSSKIDEIEAEIENIKNTSIPPSESNIYECYVNGWLKPIEDVHYQADIHNTYDDFKTEYKIGE